jgi:hypothetical protein
LIQVFELSEHQLSGCNWVNGFWGPTSWGSRPVLCFFENHQLRVHMPYTLKTIGYFFESLWTREWPNIGLDECVWVVLWFCYSFWLWVF